MSCDLMELMKEMGMRSLAYAGLCFAVEFISPVISPLLIPGFAQMQKTDKKKASNWYNRTVSFTHATVMFLRAYHFWTQQADWQLSVSADSINQRSLSIYESWTIDIMIGYLIYDTLYEMRNNKGVALMLAHHIVGAISHILTRVYCSGPASYYTMMIYLAELSTPFLNVSWLLSELNNAPSLLLVVGGLLVLTFFLSRVVMGPFLLFHLWTHWFPASGEEVLYGTNVAIVVFFILMNFYWFMQLVKKVIGTDSNKKSKKEKK